MQQKVLTTLVSLFESLVLEDSAMLNQFRGTSAEDLILALHKAGKLSHNAEAVKSKDLNAKQLIALFQKLSDSNTTNMVLLVKGPVAIAVHVTKSDDKFIKLDAKGKLKSSGLMGGYYNYTDRLKAKLQTEIGLTGLDVYVIKQPSTYVTSVRRKRAKAAPSGISVATFKSPDDFAKSLVTKFKPLWIRSMEAAKADIKGYVNLQIKNGAYNLIEPKIKRLAELDEALTDLEFDPTKQTVELISHAISAAISMAAYHYYPDKAGRLSRDWNRSTRKYTVSTNKSAVEQLFNDIAAGDMTKLGTILAFFKRNLVYTG